LQENIEIGFSVSVRREDRELAWSRSHLWLPLLVGSSLNSKYFINYQERMDVLSIGVREVRTAFTR